MKCFAIIFLATLVIGLNAQTGPCATIRAKSLWGARIANSVWLQVQPPQSFVVHHTGGPRCETQAACDAVMRDLQSTHIDTNGWADIGYNFCIGDNGVVYEGRGWNRWGAHTPGFNSNSIGFCFFGDFASVLPTIAARNTAQAFVICARDWGRLNTSYRLLGHRQDPLSTSTCPGNALFDDIQTWPNWH